MKNVLSDRKSPPSCPIHNTPPVVISKEEFPRLVEDYEFFFGCQKCFILAKVDNFQHNTKEYVLYGEGDCIKEAELDWRTEVAVWKKLTGNYEKHFTTTG